jgi:hypothetical protein
MASFCFWGREKAACDSSRSNTVLIFEGRPEGPRLSLNFATALFVTCSVAAVSQCAARGAGWEIKSFAETHSEKQTRFAAKFTCAPPQKYVAAELTLRAAAN